MYFYHTAKQKASKCTMFNHKVKTTLLPFILFHNRQDLKNVSLLEMIGLSDSIGQSLVQVV